MESRHPSRRIRHFFSDRTWNLSNEMIFWSSPWVGVGGGKRLVGVGWGGFLLSLFAIYFSVHTSPYVSHRVPFSLGLFYLAQIINHRTSYKKLRLPFFFTYFFLGEVWGFVYMPYMFPKGILILLCLSYSMYYYCSSRSTHFTSKVFLYIQRKRKKNLFFRGRVWGEEEYIC